MQYSYRGYYSWFPPRRHRFDSDILLQMITRIPLDRENRMIRVGFGKNQNRWFFRIDLWSVGYRITA